MDDDRVAAVAQPESGRQEDKTVVVGLGGSAGAIAALQKFFLQMPDKPGMAFVVLIHLDPTHESRLAEVLQPSSRLPVIRVSTTVRVEADTVYVVPPARPCG